VTDRERVAGGFTVLDGAALVAGAAVASVHIRGVINKNELIGPGWVLIWGSFLWIALTAAGPFLYVVRRHVRRSPGFPGVGDRLWALLGLPWLLTTALQGVPAAAGGATPSPLLATGLSLGVGGAALVAVAVVWATWVVVPLEQAARTFSGPWTNRLGMLLAIAWPVQCGLGMVVIG
jgi:hypothetical protein